MTGGAAGTVLCLVELDAGAPADTSLRALTFARSLAGRDGGRVAALVFADVGQVPSDVLASYGATDVYMVDPAQLAGYAPLAWARVLAGLARHTAA